MDPSDDLGSTLQIVKLSDKATTPQRATPDAAGYDLHSAVTIDIQPRTTVPIPTDIALRPPPNTYCQILSRSGMVLKHGIEVKAGTIDRDYTGNVTVLLHNTADQPYHVNTQDRIAQFIIYPIEHPPMSQPSQLVHTTHGNNGFGSTGSNTDIMGITTPKPQNNSLQEAVNRSLTAKEASTRNSNQKDTKENFIPTIIQHPYNIWLSEHPFHKLLSIQCDTTGNHPTLGMIFAPTYHKDRGNQQMESKSMH